MNAIILFSYGHLQSIDDLAPFYQHLLRKHFSEESLDRGKKLFASLGTPDPLTTVTKRIGIALSNLLTEKTNEQWTYYIGAKHSEPFVDNCLEQCKKDGIRKIVTVPLTPLVSLTGTTAYEQKVEQAFAESAIEVLHLGGYYAEPLFIELLAQRLKDALTWLPKEVEGKTEVVFTAHSLPGKENVHSAFIHQYNELALSLMEGVAPRIPHRIAYRSLGPPPQKWLGPHVLEVLRDCADNGTKAVVLCELLSIIANAEVIEEIGREAMQRTHRLGMQFVQTEYLNDSYDFVQSIGTLCMNAMIKERKRRE